MAKAFSTIENEHGNMKAILSNFGHDTITDCLGENLSNNHFKATLGELKEENGTMVPTDTLLTDPEDFGIKERLDHIFWLNPQDETRVQIDVEKTFIQP